MDGRKATHLLITYRPHDKNGGNQVSTTVRSSVPPGGERGKGAGHLYLDTAVFSSYSMAVGRSINL